MKLSSYGRGPELVIVVNAKIQLKINETCRRKQIYQENDGIEENVSSIM